MKIIKEVDKILECNDLGKHEFYTTWFEGNLNLEAIQDYCAQYYPFELKFPDFLRQAQKACSHKEGKMEIAENIYEEENVPKHHAEIWMDFAEGMGVPREKVLNSIMKPATISLLQTFRKHSTTYLGGLAAAYTYEKQVPKLSIDKISSLKKHYGVNDEKTLAFFKVHSHMDIKHSNTLARLMEKYTNTDDDKKIVLESAKECSEALMKFLSQENMLNINRKDIMVEA